MNWSLWYTFVNYIAPGRARYEVYPLPGLFSVSTSERNIHKMSFRYIKDMASTLRFSGFLMLAVIVVGCASEPSLNTKQTTTSQGTLGTALAVNSFEGISIYPKSHTVEIKAWTCLEAGWLEQVACSPNSREHEALVVVKAVPSEIHAALLLAGFVSGSPGMWYYEEGELKFKQPTGANLTIQVRYTTSDGRNIQEPISEWIRDPVNQSKFPDEPWVFGGSEFRKNPESMGPGEHYTADFTGSVIGLVTFGDEVLGFKQIISDQETVHAPQWEVNIDHVPPLGTEVTLIIAQAD